MTRRSRTAPCAAALAVACLMTAHAQDSAPSSHLVFDDPFAGDILINEVRVPKNGEAMYTYYEALGWQGLAAGYAGIQAHPRAHLYIFSIWDHKEHAAPIQAIYRGPGTETVGFGGEGTGLKSWNFQLGWSTGVWYTLVARCWPVDDHTHVGFWARAGDTGIWTHLVTMDVAVRASFHGATDAFIEDWLNTGAEPRTTHLRGGWKRRHDGSWHPFGSARYSVNTWDLEPGKRSYNFRTNWNGGVGRDNTGSFYFMTSGGRDTQPMTTNPTRFAVPREERTPSFAPLQLIQVSTEWPDDRTLRVNWKVDEKTTPPFAYEIKVFDNPSGAGQPLVLTQIQTPHARSASLEASGLDAAPAKYYLRLECRDILDRRSSTSVLPVGERRCGGVSPSR